MAAMVAMVAMAVMAVMAGTVGVMVVTAVGASRSLLRVIIREILLGRRSWKVTSSMGGCNVYSMYIL